MNNLLTRLHRWVFRQDGNFTTESLAHLLTYLRDHEPKAAARLLAKVTGVEFAVGEVKDIRITTQVTTDQGRPDMELSARDCLVYLEAKVESGLGYNQLERYRNDLDSSSASRKALVLLTRYPPPPLDAKTDKAIRWHDVGNWLANERQRKTISDPISAYVVDQFLGFLTVKGMIMQPVTQELADGTRALANLLRMMEESAATCGIAAKRFWNSSYIGYFLDNSRFFFGTHVDSANRIRFETNDVHIDVEKAQKLRQGEIWPANYVRKGWSAWGKELDLACPETQFFMRSMPWQKEYLEQFLKECIKIAESIEILQPLGAPPLDLDEPAAERELLGSANKEEGSPRL